MTDEAPEPADPREPAAVVMDALRRLTKPSSPEEIAEATGLKVATVRRTLGRLVAEREARKAGGGRFTTSRHR